MRRLLFATFLVSSAALAYEILLLRVLSIVQWHHFAYMIISIALLGYGASGTFIAIARRWLEPRFETAFSLSALMFGLGMIAAFIAGQRVPFNALEIVWDDRQLAYLCLIYLVYFVPFFFAGLCIGLAFAFRRELVSRIYFFDLAGAGTGAICIIGLLFLLSPQNVLIGLGIVALLASMLMTTKLPSRVPLLAVELVAALAMLFIVPQGLLEMRMSPYKSLSQLLQVVGSRPVQSASSPLGLVSVVESPRIPLRHAPGLSINTRFDVPEQLAVFTDGDGMSAITRFDGNADSVSYLADVTAALPYAVLDSPHVLVLGAGTGGDVLMALALGAKRVDAVELNPQITNLVSEDFRDFAGQLYQDERVSVHTAEARGFVIRSEQRYDLVQVALLDSFAASGSGVHALNENYLYTVEAFQDYLAHLESGGVLSITRWLKIPPRDNLKLVATAIHALRNAGSADPGRQLAVIRAWNTSTLLVKRGMFSTVEIAAIKEFARSHSFDTAWYPGMPSSEANRFNILDAPFLYDGISALLSDEANDFTNRYKFHIQPATDDKPYFFHFFKWSALREILSLRQRGGAGLIEWGYLVLVATLIQAAIAGAALILFPLSQFDRTWPRGTGPAMGSYFFSLGIAFLFVEIAFIQKFILFLSHPLYAVAVVLSGFLVFAGLGSACSVRMASRLEVRGWSPVTVAVAGIVLLALGYITLLPLLFDSLIGLADGARMAVSIMLIAPLAFCMGMPFPLGLQRLAERAPDFIPWAWGINGFASVISAVLATLLAIEFGFTIVIFLSLLLYAGATAMFNCGAWAKATGSTSLETIHD